MTNSISLFVGFVTLFTFTNQQSLTELRENHRPQQLTKPQVRYLANLSNTSHIDQVLDNICIPRVVGSRNHDRVRKYIVNQMIDLGWEVELDEFDDKTPNFGQLTFHNIIASLNRNAERFLVLACHYDSKFYKEHDFVGATDSAVPCAMMINLAYVMQKELSRAKSKSSLSLKLIFFDGEEAFLSWGPNDSIYGAKHIAKKMGNSLSLAKSGEQITDLEKIDILVLLDLIGAPDPTFYDYFVETSRWHLRLSNAEIHLANAGLLQKYSRNPQQTYFRHVSVSAHIEDDHIPFLLKGVPILHLIPIPFPKVWHTPKDTRDVVDIVTTENVNKILRVFVAEYLHLSVKS